MNHRRPIIPLLLLLSAAVGAVYVSPGASAQTAGNSTGPDGTTLAVRIGWGGAVQAGRWHPVYVTLSSASSRNVSLEFRAPHGSFYGMRSHMILTIGPQPQTFVVYVPLRNFVTEDLSFVVRDAATRKRLADYPGGPYLTLAGGDPINPGHSFLGISGRRATLRPLIDLLPGANLAAAHVEQEELPTAAIGYDCLDVLVLNAPDFTNLSAEQQHAITEWVRGGGNLLLWPGDTPVPDAGPLLDALPCRIGDTSVVELSKDELDSVGLTPRFAKLPSRVLPPAEGAEPVKVLGLDRVTGYERRLGFGRILVCPIDLASLQFAGATKAWSVWRGVLKGMIRRLPEEAAATPDQTAYAGMSETQAREATSMRQIGDLLGSVPGAGQFGFGYVAGILLGMMVIVGPVDWFLLKKLGRQPWTWATTSGWIALITLSAVYAGHLFKSGELHFRTFELVDQADGLAVAHNDLSALYSPRTTDYTFETRPDAWWQAASPGDEFYGYRRGAQEVVFAQTYRGSTPDPMTVNVWNLRFLQGRSSVAAPAVVDAKLKLEQRQVNGRPRKFLVGTITNVGAEPLANLAVRTQAGWTRLFGSAASATQPAGLLKIAPGATEKVEALLDPSPLFAASKDASPYGYPYNQNVPALDRTRLWDQGGDLSMRRTDRIEQWVTERSDLACVYAECENPAPAIELKTGAPIEQHWKVVRALVALSQ